MLFLHESCGESLRLQPVVVDNVCDLFDELEVGHHSEDRHLLEESFGWNEGSLNRFY